MILFYLLSLVQGGLYDVFSCLEASVLFSCSIKNTKLFDMLLGISIFGTGSLLRVLVSILKENGFKIEALWSRTLQNGATNRQRTTFYSSQTRSMMSCYA